MRIAETKTALKHAKAELAASKKRLASVLRSSKKKDAELASLVKKLSK